MTRNRIRPTVAGAEGAIAAAQYLVDGALATAANLSLTLGRPLLITGEPGTGKSRFADELARQMDCPCFQYQCKSTSEARDVLYSYDVMRRWDDTHRGAGKPVETYIEWRALGKAITCEGESVVLIDDIDKGPRDFANDLLLEFAERRFEVPEFEGSARPTHYEARGRFVVVITSNAEQELPKPFLRRCVYHYNEFPNRERLREIVSLHLRNPDLANLGPVESQPEDGALVTQAVDCFLALRTEQRLRKVPATDELLAWVTALKRWGLKAEQLDLTKLGALPLLQTMIKTPADWLLLTRQST